MNRAGSARRPPARGVMAAATGVGVVGASTWAISSGQTGLAIALAIIGAVGAAVKTVVPQNSRDRVEWTRTILDYRLHHDRDRAALRLAQACLDAGVVPLPQNAPSDGPTARPVMPRHPRPSRS